MSEEQQAHVKRDLRMLIFPGTSLLVKSLYKDPDAVANTAAAAAADPAANPGLPAATDAGVLAACQATVEAASKAAAEAAAEAAAKGVPTVVIPSGAAGPSASGVGQQLPLHYLPNGIVDQPQHQQMRMVGQFGSVSQHQQQPQQTVQPHAGPTASAGMQQQQQQQQNVQQSQQQQPRVDSAAAGASSSFVFSAGGQANTTGSLWTASAAMQAEASTAQPLHPVALPQKHQQGSMLQITCSAPGSHQLLLPQQQPQQQQVAAQQGLQQQPVPDAVTVQDAKGVPSPGMMPSDTASPGGAPAVPAPSQQQLHSVPAQQHEVAAAAQPELLQPPVAPESFAVIQEGQEHAPAGPSIIQEQAPDQLVQQQEEQAPGQPVQQQHEQAPGQGVQQPGNSGAGQPVPQQQDAAQQQQPAADQAGHVAKADVVGRQSVAGSEGDVLVDLPAMPRTSGGLL